MRSEMPDIRTETCYECAEEFPEADMELTQHSGWVCDGCLRDQFPRHITIGGPPWTTRDEDLEIVIEGPDDRRIVVHTASGIAVRARTTDDARRLLRKVIADVIRVESNERYGVCME
jgi:hypothetical protein